MLRTVTLCAGESLVTPRTERIAEGRGLDSIVIDNGSGSIRAGFSGDGAPNIVIPVVTSETTCLEYRDLYPVENGIVKDWEAMETIYARIFLELGAESELQPVLTTDAVLNPRYNKEKMAQLFFETFHVPALKIFSAQLLAFATSGRTNGILLDCGYSSCISVPIWEGYDLPHAINRIDLGGQDLSAAMVWTLRDRGFGDIDVRLATDIKERLCSLRTGVGSESYDLPDGRKVTLSAERSRCPQILFQPPEGSGIHHIVDNSISRSAANQ